MSLTKKQKEILHFIEEYIQSEGLSPTYAEIQEHFSFKSKGTVHDYISYLKKAGHLQSESGKNRGIELCHRAGSCVSIPVLGKVAAGKPLDVMNDWSPEDYLTVPQTMVRRGRCYALIVEGQSMIEDGIFDGDSIIVRSQEEALNGETVVALIDDQATVKRYEARKDQVILHPANPDMRPIVVNKKQRFCIQGVVVGLLRSYSKQVSAYQSKGKNQSIMPLSQF